VKVRIRALDRYVFTEFWKIFATAALGFPILLYVIDSTDNLDKYLSRHLGIGSIALSYIYWLPDSMFMALPAAVLFATVFAIGSLTRHSEITAAKASGISFHRLIAPIAIGAAVASIIGLVIGELAPIANKKRLDIVEPDRGTTALERYNFAYAGENGRVYKVGALRVAENNIAGITIERKGSGPRYPSYVLSGNDASYRPKVHRWMVSKGAMHVIPDSLHNVTFTFDSALDKSFTRSRGVSRWRRKRRRTWASPSWGASLIRWTGRGRT
jgi:Predicted permeases